MASYQDCIAAIQKSVGEDVISTKQAEQILEHIDEVVKVKKTQGPLENLEDAILTELGQTISAIRETALIEKRNALINARKYGEILNYIRKHKLPGEGMLAYLVGGIKVGQGARNSIDLRGKAIEMQLQGQFISELKGAQLFELWKSGDLDRQVANELWELGRPVGEGKPGITGDKQAQQMAEILNKFQNVAIFRQNRAGAYIRNMPGYIVRQAHDMFRIRNAGYEAWRDYVLPRLDHQATFGPVDPEKFLKEAYKGLVSGMHYKVKGEVEADKINYLLGFKGPGNLAKKLSEERLLHFKNADSWFEYNQQFGRQNLREAVHAGMGHAARNIAMLEGLGTNPVRMMQQVLAALKTENKDNLAAFDSIKEEMLMNRFKEIDGTTKIPVNLSLAKVSQGIRTMNMMSKLGGAVLSSITDIPFKAAELRYQGQPILKAWASSITDVFKGRGNAERQEMSLSLGAGFDGMLAEIHSRFSSDDTMPGVMSKLQTQFFKLNLMTWWNDIHKAGVAHATSAHLASKRDLSFDQLDSDTKRMFSLYNIDAKKWDLIKSAAHQPEGKDYTLLLPDLIQKIDDSRIKSALDIPQGDNTPAISRKISQFKDDLETTLRGYFIDRAEYGVPHPGAAEHALLYQGTRQGTALGEIVRLLAQFKSFPVTVLRKGIGRELYGYGSDSIAEAIKNKNGEMVGLVQLMITTTLFGYGSMVAKDLLRGQTPRDYEKPSTWMAAMSQGGGLGIYGDFLFGEFSRYGRSAVATLVGPTFGQIDDMAELWTRFRTGDDVAANAVRMTLNNTPFINLFYTRGALDYLFLYQLQESVSPGFLHRLESRIMQEQGKEFFMPPSQLIPFGGGDRLLESVR